LAASTISFSLVPPPLLIFAVWLTEAVLFRQLVDCVTEKGWVAKRSWKSQGTRRFRLSLPLVVLPILNLVYGIDVGLPQPGPAPSRDVQCVTQRFAQPGVGTLIMTCGRAGFEKRKSETTPSRSHLDPAWEHGHD
jgi:hypothetical protein